MARYKETKPAKKTEKTPVAFHKDLRLLAKRANQAMVRLERLQIQSPAYEYAQAMLEMLGREGKGNRGRRFSETGRATYNEYEMVKSRIERFLNMSTRTESGAKAWVDKIWQGALKSEVVQISESNITRDDWLDFWKNMPSKQEDRVFGSEVIVNLLKTRSLKNGEIKEENRMSAEEIADAIQSAKDVKHAFKNLGISYRDYMSVKKTGSLPKKTRKR